MLENQAIDENLYTLALRYSTLLLVLALENNGQYADVIPVRNQNLPQLVLNILLNDININKRYNLTATLGPSINKVFNDFQVIEEARKIIIEPARDKFGFKLPLKIPKH